MAPLGADYLITRNLIAAMVPLVVGRRRREPHASWPRADRSLCAIGVIAFAGVENNPFYQRDDWASRGGRAGPGPAWFTRGRGEPL